LVRCSMTNCESAMALPSSSVIHGHLPFGPMKFLNSGVNFTNYSGRNWFTKRLLAGVLILKLLSKPNLETQYILCKITIRPQKVTTR
jgi:hypothetical protein